MNNSKTIHRPFLTTPERACPSCGRGFVAVWGWLFLPGSPGPLD